jgi:hypothetical protein
LKTARLAADSHTTLLEQVSYKFQKTKTKSVFFQFSSIVVSYSSLVNLKVLLLRSHFCNFFYQDLFGLCGFFFWCFEVMKPGMSVERVCGDRTVGSEKEYECEVIDPERAHKKRKIWLKPEHVPAELKDAHDGKYSRDAERRGALAKRPDTLAVIPRALPTIPLIAATQQSVGFALRLPTVCKVLTENVTRERNVEKGSKRDIEMGTGTFLRFEDNNMVLSYEGKDLKVCFL